MVGVCVLVMRCSVVKVLEDDVPATGCVFKVNLKNIYAKYFF